MARAWYHLRRAKEKRHIYSGPKPTPAPSGKIVEHAKVGARHEPVQYARPICAPQAIPLSPHTSAFPHVLPTHPRRSQNFNIPSLLKINTAVTTPATNPISPNQKHQHSHVLCLLFFFWLASHDPLHATWLAGPVIVVHVLKTSRGRPERDIREGERGPDECEWKGGLG